MKKKKQIDSISAAYVTAGIVLVGLMTLIGVSAFLSVNTIIVEGLVQYTAQEVAEAAGVSRGDNLFYLNRQRTAARISENLPYISSAEVSKDLPDTLIIKVTESAALAYIPFAGDALITDSSGRVLDIEKMLIGVPIEAGGKKLIEVRGVPVVEAGLGSIPKPDSAFEANLSVMQDILISMEREGVASDVNYLDVSVITNISFGYLDMYRVVIGGRRDFKPKISGLISTISQIQDGYPNVSGQLIMTDPSGEWTFIPDD